MFTWSNRWSLEEQKEREWVKSDAQEQELKTSFLNSWHNRRAGK